tara:strand:+ start:66359 stop:66667 length:309 start_codon:yes stop_codon:yes gene_type:complete
MAKDKGLPDFKLDDDDDDVPAPSKEEIETVRRAGEDIGFVSEKPVKEQDFRKVPKSAFTYSYTLRMRPEDKDRFDHFAWKNRWNKGEAFQKLLDLAEEKGLM